MTHFERAYLLSRPSKITVNFYNSLDKESGVIDQINPLQKSNTEMALQMEYRELDRQSMELEKEIKAIKALRMEMEKYKGDFILSVEDKATKKIKEVINGIERMIK